MDTDELIKEHARQLREKLSAPGATVFGVPVGDDADRLLVAAFYEGERACNDTHNQLMGARFQRWLEEAL